MRLLFGREFAFQDVLQIWDLLFAEGLRPELIEYVCVAMLLRIRWQRENPFPLRNDTMMLLTPDW